MDITKRKNEWEQWINHEKIYKWWTQLSTKSSTGKSQETNQDLSDFPSHLVPQSFSENQQHFVPVIQLKLSSYAIDSKVNDKIDVSNHCTT